MPIQSDLRFTFSAGKESFDVVEFTLHEALSETFLLAVELTSDNPAIDFGQVLDRSALLTLWHGERPVRYVHGAVSSFVQHDSGFRRTRYSAVIEPRLARLKLSSDWRIFQTLTVPQITEAVLKAHGLTQDYEQRLTTEHQAREYCVQAGDTDYHFVERIMREEGFFYSFRHSAEGHQLVHSDRLFIHGRVGDEPVQYNPTPGGDQPQPALRRFAYSENVRTARQTQRDYTFHHPNYSHQHSRDGVELDHQGREYERYDYPARAKFDEAGKPFAENRLRGHRRDARIALVEGDDPRLQPGISFILAGHPRDDMNRGWRPVSIVHHGKQHTSQGEESAEAQLGTHYSYQAELVPDDAEWRAEPLPKPRIDGPQNATVVGPKNEEIFTDEYARVKVQFAWDREGKQDEYSSCWIRVSQNISGATWGHMAIPRIGQEVIVDHFDGDPDQPVITGRTFNRLQLPPYELPRHKTRMTLKSKTHKGEGFNELRFEDEQDQEEIYVHAQKDQNIHVNHDESRAIGNDQTNGIGRDRNTNIGQDDTHSVGRDRKEHIRQDVFSTIDRNEIRKVGNSQREDIASSRQVKIGENETIVIEGIQSIEAKTSLRTLTRDHVLQGTDRILIRGPAGTIILDSNGISLDAPNILLKGNVKILSPGSNQVKAIEAAIREGSPLIEECPLDKGN
ncbi:MULTISPECIES: type VI secretion system Vgr family protein [unclassified Pseudomonas]|uniref:type VI secretion system Vgr family protein n=1 Tax=unclassified Pseudomonas TaxID=196821 RepID=UPI000996E6C4|nr:type VI secretion system tip protein TssI/VgrG [Pseudomonas sp. MF4836]OOV95290.1 type VI secretion protein VgrG [Pseudomonas sp. MF4836]